MVTRQHELGEILRFAARSRTDDGFVRLDAAGRTASAQIETIINARMAYCFSVGALELKDPTWARLAAHAINAVAPTIGRRPEVMRAADKESRGPVASSGYDLCFAALAAATGVSASIPGSEAALQSAIEAIDRSYWRDREGFFDTEPEADGDDADYIGANVNMHAVEAFMAIGGATGDPVWYARALRIVDRFVHGVARTNDWLMPEHFGRDWSVRWDFNAADKAHEFQPYGVTIGHLFEWSRLTAELATTLPEPPEWMTPAATLLYEAARTYGWSVDGAEGFVYTVDWDGKPVVRERMHWVCCEAIASAGTLAALGHDGAADDLATWQAYAERCFVDHVYGSWYHELSSSNRPSQTVFSGKPDAYHIVQAVTIPSRFPAADARLRSRAPEALEVDVMRRLRELASRGKRMVLGLVGPPGSGKSSLASSISQLTGLRLAVVPMDGFHLAQSQLAELGLADRKGAIETFDSGGYARLLAVISEDRETVFAPDFDRSIEEPIAGAIRVDPGVRLVVTEGNYLLDDTGMWPQARAAMDEVWYVHALEGERGSRLVRRHQQFGRSHDEAVAWVDGVDQPNGRRVTERRHLADRWIASQGRGWRFVDEDGSDA